MKAALFLLCAVAWTGTLDAFTFHRSFRNGYPKEWNVTKEQATDSVIFKGGDVTVSDGRGHMSGVKYGGELRGQVTRIIDGGALQLGRRKIRLMHIDGLKPSQKFGKEAMAFLKQRVLYREVVVTCHGRDPHGFIQGVVRHNGTDVALLLVGEGLAWYKPAKGDGLDFSKAEDEARQAKRGLWSQLGTPLPKSAVPPAGSLTGQSQF